MIDFRNPYTPGAGFKPKYLAGRSDVIDRARVLISAVAEGYPTRSVIYYGLRGVGKTVLLNEVEKIADSKNLLCKHIEVRENSSFVRQLNIAARAFAQTLSLKESLKGKLGKLVSVLKSFSAVWNPEDNTLGIEWAGYPQESSTAGTGDLSNDFTELLITLGTCATQANTAVCFFIDEIQYAGEEELEALIAADHRVSQLGLPVIFFCAGLPKILKSMGNAKSYTERLFEFVEIGSLSPEHAREAIIYPAQKLNAHYTEDAVAEILRETNGYPYFIQELCSVIWENTAERQIDKSAVTSSIDTAHKKLDAGFFSVRYDRCTDMEKRFMIAMVKCGELPCTVANVAKILQRSAKSVSPLRAQLIAKGMIYPTGYGEIDFTVPQFDSYIHRINPELQL